MPLKTLFIHFAVYLALWTVAVSQPLLQMYGDNLAVFVAARIEGWPVMWFALGVAFVPPVVLSCVEALCAVISVGLARGVHRAIVGALLVLVVALLLRNLTLGSWIAELLVVIAVAAAIVMAYLRWNVMRTWLGWMSSLSVAVVVLFAMSANAVIWPPDVSVLDTVTTTTVAGGDDNNTSVARRDDVSVVWIVLDEAPLFPLLTPSGEINAQRFPGFAQLASQSTWYRNALATSQTTTDAVPAMLTGKWPRAGVAPVLANHRNNLFTLMNGHLAMDAHEVATALCPRQVCATVSVSGSDEIADPSLAAGGAGSTSSTAPDVSPEEPATVAPEGPDYGQFLRDALVVMGHKLLPAGLRGRLPAIDEGWGGFGAVDADTEGDLGGDLVDDQSPTASVTKTTTVTKTTMVTGTTLAPVQTERAQSTTVAEWEAGGPMSQVPVWDDVITRAARADRPTLHFAHVLLPHRPWMLAPDMRRSRALPTDKRSNEIEDRVRDEYQAHLLQYVATDVMLQKMMTALQRSANWDRTMVIVTADHGITFEPGESKRKTIDVSARGTLEDIYRVPMFVKYPDQQTARVSDCDVTGVDLLPTVIGATGRDVGWTLDGVDLARACPDRPARTIIWPDGKATMSTTFDAAVERAQRYDRWVDAAGDVDDIVRAGVHGDLVGSVVTASGDETQLEWSLDRPQDFTRVGDGQFGFVPTQVQGLLRASRDFAADEEGVLVVNGRVVGVVSEMAGMRAGQSTTFRSTLLARLLPPGRHTVEMWVASGGGPTRRLTRIAL